MSDKIREALAGMLAIVGESRGGDGYHLNGDIAEWDEFPEVEAALAQQPAPAAPVTQEPVAFVSQETFSSDGTSDILTRNLPIGTALYAAPPAAEQPDTGHELFAELYQILGELGASEAVLDQVLAASQGDPLPHASLLPYAAGRPDTVRVPVETLRRHADHLQTAGYNNAADDLRALLAGGAE